MVTMMAATVIYFMPKSTWKTIFHRLKMCFFFWTNSNSTHIGCNCTVFKFNFSGVVAEAKLQWAHLTQREIEFINTMVSFFFSPHSHLQRVTASCTIHKFFKPSLRLSHWDLCLSIGCFVNNKKKGLWGQMHVCFIIVYMLSKEDLSPKIPQQRQQ